MTGNFATEAEALNVGLAGAAPSTFISVCDFACRKNRQNVPNSCDSEIFEQVHVEVRQL